MNRSSSSSVGAVSSNVLPPNTGTNPQIPTVQDHVFNMIISRLDNVENEFKIVKTSVAPVSSYFSTAKNVLRFTLILSFITPIIQLFVIYFLVKANISANLTEIIGWVVGGISILTLIEMVALPFLYWQLKEKVETLENKI